MSSCGEPIQRVKLTPAPSDVGIPERIELTLEEGQDMVNKTKTAGEGLIDVVIEKVVVD